MTQHLLYIESEYHSPFHGAGRRMEDQRAWAWAWACGCIFDIRHAYEFMLLRRFVAPLRTVVPPVACRGVDAVAWRSMSWRACSSHPAGACSASAPRHCSTSEPATSPSALPFRWPAAGSSLLRAAVGPALVVRRSVLRDVGLGWTSAAPVRYMSGGGGRWSSLLTVRCTTGCRDLAPAQCHSWHTLAPALAPAPTCAPLSGSCGV